jgi:hypothetical protein
VATQKPPTAKEESGVHRFLRIRGQLPDEVQAPGMPPAGRILTRGWIKASHAVTKDEALSKPYRPYYRRDKPQPMEPGRVYRYEIEIFLAATPTDSKWVVTRSTSTRNGRRIYCCR